MNALLETDEVDAEHYLNSFEPRYCIYSKVHQFNPTRSFWGGGAGEQRSDRETGRGYWHYSPIDAATFTHEEAKRELDWLINNYKSLGYPMRQAVNQVGMELVDNKLLAKWRKQREYQARRKAKRNAKSAGLSESLTDILLDLTDEYGSAHPRPKGLSVYFVVIDPKTTYAQAFAKIRAILDKNGLLGSKLEIKPGPEVAGPFNRTITLILPRDLLI